MEKIIARLIVFGVLIWGINYLSNNKISNTISDKVKKIFGTPKPVVTITPKVKPAQSSRAKQHKQNGVDFTTLVFKHEYKENYTLVIENGKRPQGKIKYPLFGGDMTRFMLALRWKCITDAVEDRYNLPRGIIFAMMIQETSGVEFLLNAKGDGGAGLCHMQPAIAKWFGLKTINDCDSIICRKHAAALQKFIDENRFNRNALAEIDGRLDHVKNLDAVGRILSYYMGLTDVNDGPLRSALRGYTGRTNYAGYWKNVKGYMNHLNDSSFMKKVEAKFNKLNPHLTIDGTPADWNTYLASYCTLCGNYGLEEYKLMPKYHPRNSDIVKLTYRNFL